MELPLGTKAGRQATHDFLSLYSFSTAHDQQDPKPSQGKVDGINTSPIATTVAYQVTPPRPLPRGKNRAFPPSPRQHQRQQYEAYNAEVTLQPKSTIFPQDSSKSRM